MNATENHHGANIAQGRPAAVANSETGGSGDYPPGVGDLSVPVDNSAVEFHSVTEIFPLIDGEEFEALVDDIRANGLREPIWRDGSGRIIDGRNRYRACRAAGVQPRYTTWDGEESLVALVVSLNLHRRHLTPSQRAAIAVEILPKLELEARDRRNGHLKRGDQKPVGQFSDHRERSAHQAADLVQVNHDYVSKAKTIKNRSPEKFTEIRSGRRTVPEVYRELRVPLGQARPGPAANDPHSIGMLLRQLRAEITRRRKENKDQRAKRNWNSELILKREQSDLLDWIETELDRLTETLSRGASQGSADRA